MVVGVNDAIKTAFMATKIMMVFCHLAVIMTIVARDCGHDV